MKRTSILAGFLLILLTASACATNQTASQPESITAPTVAPSGTPALSGTPASSPTANGQGVIVSTSAASSSGQIQPTSLPLVPGSGVASTPLTPPEGGVTLTANGATYLLHPGDRFLLNLGSDVYDWTINIDDQSVLSRVVNVLVIRGAQGIYEAHKNGQVTLTADGDPLCRQVKPACSIPSVSFKVTVIVQ